MKKNVLLFVFAICFVMNPVIGQKDYKQLYERKIHTYSKMNSAGWVMIGTGAGFALGGCILSSSLSGEHNTKEELKETEASVLLTLGIGLVAGGIVFKSIGSRKAWYYRTKLRNLSMGIMCDPKKQGLSLTYRF